MPQQTEIDQVLDRAIALHQHNRTKQARPLYEKVLDARPEDPDANHLLGLIDQEEGNLTLALRRITKARSLDPQNAVLLNNLGGLYRDLGQIEAAIEAYEAGLAVSDRLPALHNNLGVAYQETGRHEKAIASFEKALSLNPKYAEAYNNLGLSLFKCDRPADAVKAFEKALSIAPKYVKALGNLGTALAQLDKHRTAISAFKLALESGPVAGIHDNLGTSLTKLGRFEEALDAHDRAIKLDPLNADYLVHRAALLAELSRSDEAEENLEKAIGLNARNAHAHLVKGTLLGQRGDGAGAIDAFRTALALKPDLVEAYRVIAWAGRFSEENEVTSEIRSAYARSEPDSEARMHLAFALGKIEEDQKAYGQAFDRLLEGNAIKRRSLVYSTSETAKKFDRLCSSFTPELFEQFKGVGHSAADPIFIVGMPRSGTTLVETIIASHRDVSDGGEMIFFSEAARQAGVSDGNFPPAVRFGAKSDPILQTAEHYLRFVRERFSPQGRFTDKLPENFFHTGLIHLVFPKAKIIHCRRSPMDTCLSIFKIFFSVGGLPYAYDLTELGEYYRLYERLMRHWDTVMPGVIYALDYETLVADPENETRKLIAHCGLDWDDACLSFHTSKRRVQTASLHQVRRPIYTSSVNLAERYGAALAPLMKALNTELPGEKNSR